jgi:Acyltransferase family.
MESTHLDRQVKKRIHTLLIPYILWNLIAILVSLFFCFKSGTFSNLASWFESIGGFRAFWNSSSGLWPIDGPLWFIRNLIILVVISPIIHYFVKQSGIIGLIVLGVLYVFRWWKEIPGFEIAGIMFFSLGSFFSINQIDFSSLFKRHRLLTTCLAIPVLVGIVFTYWGNNDIYQKFRCIFTLVGSASVIGIVSYLIENNKIHERAFLSNSSFLIFAAHNVFLLGKITSHMSKIYTSTSQIALIIKYFAAPSITIIILLGCYYAMSKLTPRLLALLTGGRH